MRDRYGEPGQVPRRALLAGAAGALAGPLAPAGVADAGAVPGPPDRGGAAPEPARDRPAGAVVATGARQAGVDRPVPPQTYLQFTVFDLQPGRPVREVLAELGARILDLTRSGAGLAGLPPGDLTVTVGLGPDLVAAVDPALPGAVALPRFAREQIFPRARGGDLMVQVCAGDPLVAGLADQELGAGLADLGAAPRWSQAGRRPAPVPGAPAGVVRNVLGFHDGVMVPRLSADLDAEVWLDRPAAVAGGTVAVVRRLRVDVPGFLGQSLAEQEAAVGRRRADGVPLSGGPPFGPVDLGARTPDGRYLLPLLAHARRTHPRTARGGKLLRRGYSFRNGPDDQGLLFLSFHRELGSFVGAQRASDAGDELMRFVTATASGTFLVLPGFADDRPLGRPLFRPATRR